MGRKKKSKFKSFIKVMNACIGIIGIILAGIAVTPIILDAYRAPKLEIIRQSVHNVNDRIIAEYTIINSGNAIANDVFLQIQGSQGDRIVLPFSVKYDLRNEGRDWELNIASLAPGEFTGISVFSENVKDFAEIEAIYNKLPDPINIVSVDYREGKGEEVIRDDSPELKKFIKEKYSK